MSDRKLIFSITIHDCEVQTFRAGGKGGQNQNKRDTGVRVKHHQSGAVGESREERSQLQNKKKAFRRMAESDAFQTWAKLKSLSLPAIEDVVDELMEPQYLVVEGRDEDGKWKLLSDGAS